MPKRLQDKFIATFSSAASLSVLKILRESGFKPLAASLENPLFSARRESPIHTAYMQNKVSAVAAAFSPPPKSVDNSLSGATIVMTTIDNRKTAVKIAFID